MPSNSPLTPTPGSATPSAVVGAQGHLATTDTQPYTPVDYTATTIPDDVVGLFYHLDDDEKLRMFPIDSNLRECLTSSVATTRRAVFREEVANRDKHLCVLSQTPERYCDAVHMAAHAKRDNVRPPIFH